VLSEVEHVCDRIAIVREGKLVTVSTLDQLPGIRAFRIEIDFADGVPADRLRAVPGFELIGTEEHRATGMLRGSFEPLLAAVAGHRVTGLVSREPSLEEIFLTYYSDAPLSSAAR
jgi:ABC-2 type transport system ATP-binding protein